MIVFRSRLECETTWCIRAFKRGLVGGSISFYKELLRRTRGARERSTRLKEVLQYLNSDRCIENYLKQPASSATKYLSRRKKAQRFLKNRPAITEMITKEIENYGY